MPSKKIQVYLALVCRNSKKFRSILALSKSRILKQGSGCFIPGHGVSYADMGSKTKDSIGILFDNSTNLNSYWGPINGESQKSLVKTLRSKFGINISYDSEHVRFVQFLDHLQMAHDLAFDEFSFKKVECPMIKFLIECDLIIKEFRL